jgi:ribosomal protein L7/L12
MSDTAKLRENAVDALKQGRMIEAIKLTRVASNLGLKDAKDQVDAYLLQHPEIMMQKSQLSQESSIRFIIILIGAALLFWLLYQL